MEWDNLHELLRSLYDDMMPLAGDMAAVAKGLAGLGALFYVALKVWQALSRAEPIDMFPLLRPFALGLCIMFFPTIVLGTINAVLSPVVTGTNCKSRKTNWNTKQWYEIPKPPIWYQTKSLIKSWMNWAGRHRTLVQWQECIWTGKPTR
jgi:conjugative transposon TraJ protein